MDNINKMIQRCAKRAAILGELDELKQWLDYIPSDASVLNPLLQEAVYANQLKIVEYLFARGAQVDQVDEQDNTLLSIALRVNAQEVAEWLLNETNISPVQSNNLGWTPLHFAALNDNASMCNRLIQKQGNTYATFNGRDISGIDILHGSLHKEEQQYIESIRSDLEREKVVYLEKKKAVIETDSVNRQNLLAWVKQLNTLSERHANDLNKQSLLCEVLILMQPESDPQEWFDALKDFILFLLEDNVSTDNWKLYLAIVNGVPIVDVLLARTSDSVTVLKNLDDERGYSVLDVILLRLQLFSLHKGFMGSTAYKQYTKTIAQLVQYGAQLNKLEWTNVSDAIKNAVDDYRSKLILETSTFWSESDKLYDYADISQCPTPPSTQDSQEEDNILLSPRPGF